MRHVPFQAVSMVFVGCLLFVGTAFSQISSSPEEEILPIKPDTPDHVELADGFFVLSGAVNTGVLVHDGEALLIDCCDTVIPKRLADLGVSKVSSIYFTQFRRPNTAGAASFKGTETRLYGPEKERQYFEQAKEYWADWKNRWHIYHSRPGRQVPANSIPLTGTVKGGDSFEWNGYTINVLDTPGTTDGAVSYLVTSKDKRFLFCGDVICGPGKIWDLYSLQKGFKVVGDYHGFLGARGMLLGSLGTVRAAKPEVVIPSHGKAFAFSEEAVDLLEKKLDELWRNYAAITALNHYFSKACEDVADDPQRMKPAGTADFPKWIQRVAGTSIAVESDSKALVLIDCGEDSVLETLDEWSREKGTHVEACWVTHYHDDHVDSLQRLANRKIPIFCDASMAPILEYPQRYCLPCIAPCPVPVAKATKNGESWQWHEFTLTAFHFPGQTLYHGGLLVEGHGKKVFFAGDSFAPTGLDDYTSGNRVFLGPQKGMWACLEILQKTDPDFIINQHQGKAFRFSSEQLDQMETLLAKRQEIIQEVTPWNNANFALDENWIRVYPYEQEVSSGAVFVMDIELTNHCSATVQASAEAVLPANWTVVENTIQKTVLPAATCGLRGAEVTNPDGVIRLRLKCPESADPGLYVITAKVWWAGHYLGQVVHGLVRVRGE